MSEVVECAYCGHEAKIEYDDFMVINEEYRKIQCEDCGKNFVWTVYITYSSHAKEAPCLNNEGEHQLTDFITFKNNKKIRVIRCEYCDYREEVPYERR